MGTKSTLILGLAVLAVALSLLLATEEWGIEGRPEGRPGWPHLLEDPHDRYADMQYGYWLPSGVRPYLDEVSLYPQLTTWVMGLPFLALDHGIARGEPSASIREAARVLAENGVPERDAGLMARAGKQPSYLQGLGNAPGRDQVLARLAARPGIDGKSVRAGLERSWRALDERELALARNRVAYGNAHHVLMGAFFALDLVLLVLCLRELGAPAAWALAMLLPGSLYFGFNRHESFVMSTALAALLLQLRGRRIGAGAMLGLAAMAKLWPAFLFPLFASHSFSAERARLRAGGGGASVLSLLWRAVGPPGLALAAVCAAVNAVTFFHGGGGVEAVSFLYRYLLGGRGPNHSSVLALMTDPERWAWFAPESRETLERVFQALQVAPAIVLALAGVRSRAALVHGCAVVGLSAAIWSYFFSPQWVWWSLPFALLLAAEFWPYRWLVPLVAAGIYVQLPLVYYHELERMKASGAPSAFFWHVLTTRAAVLFLFLAVALAGFFAARRRPDGGARAAGGS
jgi:hypothetical protein